jgi:hypothetical protein
MCGGFTGEFMFTREEMSLIVDRYSTYTAFGWHVDVVGIRNELYSNFDFTELQAQQVIREMRDAGYLPQ